MTTLDGYPMARAGRPGRAIGLRFGPFPSPGRRAADDDGHARPVRMAIT